MKRMKAWRAERRRARLRGGVMTNEELTRGYYDARFSRRLFAAAFSVILVGGLAFGLQLQRNTERAQQTADAIAAARDQASESQCHVDNFRRVQMGQAFRKAAQAFVDATYAAQHRAPSAVERAQIAAYLDAEHAAGEAPFPHRDCTAAGRAAWNQHPPVSDTAPCDPDGKGTCR